MSGETKNPMSNFGFRCMAWFFKLRDLFVKPGRRLEKVRLGERMSVLDYGCGPGSYTIPAAKLVGPEGKVFAVDIHPLAVNTIEKKASKEGLRNIETVLVRGYDTGIPDSSIDRVLLLDTLHGIDDPEALFREIHRVLKRDGLVFMDQEHMSESRARELVERTGLFAIAETEGGDWLVAPRQESDRRPEEPS